VHSARRTADAGTRRAPLAAFTLLALGTGSAFAALLAPADAPRGTACDAEDGRAPFLVHAPGRGTRRADLLSAAPETPARFDATPAAHAPQPMVVADIVLPKPQSRCAKRRGSPPNCGSCGSRGAAPAETAPPAPLRPEERPADPYYLREMIFSEFWHDLNVAGDPTSLGQETADVLLAAARGLAADGARDRRPEMPNLAQLRSRVPDGVVRQLIRVLPRLARQRDLAPIVQVRPTTGSGSGTSHASAIIVVGYPRALGDGTVCTNWVLMNEDDPRLATARQDARAARAQYEKEVEAILGVPLAEEMSPGR